MAAVLIFSAIWWMINKLTQLMFLTLTATSSSRFSGYDDSIIVYVVLTCSIFRYLLYSQWLLWLFWALHKSSIFLTEIRAQEVVNVTDTSLWWWSQLYYIPHGWPMNEWGPFLTCTLTSGQILLSFSLWCLLSELLLLFFVGNTRNRLLSEKMRLAFFFIQF